MMRLINTPLREIIKSGKAFVHGIMVQLLFLSQDPILVTDLHIVGLVTSEGKKINKMDGSLSFKIFGYQIRVIGLQFGRVEPVIFKSFPPAFDHSEKSDPVFIPLNKKQSACSIPKIFIGIHDVRSHYGCGD